MKPRRIDRERAAVNEQINERRRYLSEDTVDWHVAANWVNLLTELPFPMLMQEECNFHGGCWSLNIHPLGGDSTLISGEDHLESAADAVCRGWLAWMKSGDLPDGSRGLKRQGTEK